MEVYSNISLQILSHNNVKYYYDEYFSFNNSITNDIKIIHIDYYFKPIFEIELIKIFLEKFKNSSDIYLITNNLNNFQIRNQSDLLSRLAKMTPTDKVARLYAGGDNLWKDFGYNFSKSQFSDVVTNLDEVAEMFKYLGKNWDPINVQTGVKKTLDDGLDEIAAYMIRNTYPTYSKVPPAIQTLRKF